MEGIEIEREREMPASVELNSISSHEWEARQTACQQALCPVTATPKVKRKMLTRGFLVPTQRFIGFGGLEG